MNTDLYSSQCPFYVQVGRSYIYIYIIVYIYIKYYMYIFVPRKHPTKKAPPEVLKYWSDTLLNWNEPNAYRIIVYGYVLLLYRVRVLTGVVLVILENNSRKVQCDHNRTYRYGQCSVVCIIFFAVILVMFHFIRRQTWLWFTITLPIVWVICSTLSVIFHSLGGDMHNNKSYLLDIYIVLYLYMNNTPCELGLVTLLLFQIECIINDN